MINFSIPVNDKVSLKLRHPEDAEEMFSVTDKNRNYLRRWLPWVDKTLSTEDSRKYIEEQLEKFEKKEAADFGIVYEGKLVGSVGFHKISLAHKKGEVGYWISEGCSGKGIVTDCVRALTAYGFSELNLNRIVIKCSTLNEKSRAIPERLGFKLEGILRQSEIVNEVVMDTLVFALLREEWGKE